MKRTNSAQGMVCRKFELTKFCYYWVSVCVCVRKKREKTKLLLLGMKKELVTRCIKKLIREYEQCCADKFEVLDQSKKMHLIKLTREEVEN